MVGNIDWQQLQMLYLSSLFLNIYYKVCNTNKVDVIMFGFKEIPLHVVCNLLMVLCTFDVMMNDKHKRQGALSFGLYWCNTNEKKAI